MTPEPAQPAEAWLNDPASLESGEPAQPAESPEARALRAITFEVAALKAFDFEIMDIAGPTNWQALMNALNQARTTLAATTARPTERGAVVHIQILWTDDGDHVLAIDEREIVGTVKQGPSYRGTSIDAPRKVLLAALTPPVTVAATDQAGEVEKLREALAVAKRAILKAAQDTLWCDDSPVETVVDRIDALLAEADGQAVLPLPQRCGDLRVAAIKGALCLSGFAGEGLCVDGHEDPAIAWSRIAVAIGLPDGDDDDLRAALALPATDQAAEVERLREALKPFAKAGEIAGPRGEYSDFFAYRPAAGDEYAITGDHLRAAHEALATQPATGRTMGGEVLFRAFMAGDVGRLTTTALPDEWPNMQPSYRKAWEDFAAALQNGGE